MNPSVSGNRLAHHPMMQLVLSRMREFWRQPAAVFWVYGFPLLMMVALGTAFRNRPVDKIPVTIVETSEAPAILKILQQDERFIGPGGGVEILSLEECKQRLRTGKTLVMISANASPDADYTFTYDPERPGSLAARNAINNLLQKAGGRLDPLTVSNNEVREPGGRYIDFLVPGLLGMGLMGGGMWGVGFAIVNLRIRKLLKRYLATPMKRSHFLGSMMISRLLFTVTEVLILVLGARWLFGVVNHGSFLAVALLVILGACQFGGMGLLIASRAETTETVSGLMNLVMLPMWIGSGVFYSVERFPAVLQMVLNALPLTPLIYSLRSVMQDGASLLSLLPQIGLISLWTIVTFALAMRWFRWQ